MFFPWCLILLIRGEKKKKRERFCAKKLTLFGTLFFFSLFHFTNQFTGQVDFSFYFNEHPSSPVRKLKETNIEH